MKRDRAETTDAEPHVFDQTNGLVDRGVEKPEQATTDSDRLRNQTVGGIAMLSANRPAG